MDLNVKIDLAKLKALPRHLKWVLGVIAFDIVLVTAATLVLSDQVDESQSRIDTLRRQLSQLQHQNKELRSQIEKYPEMLSRYNEAASKGIFALLDRVKLINETQEDSGRHHLSGLHYKVEAEKTPPGSGTKYHLDSALVTLESGALLDTDAVAFWDNLFGRLPGHYQVVEASLERLRDIDPKMLSDIRSGRPASAVAAKLTFRARSLTTGQEGQ